MVDTEVVLWLIPAVLIAVAFLAKAYVHWAKPSRYHQSVKSDG